MKNETRTEITSILFGWAVVSLSSAWKNVGMTMTRNKLFRFLTNFSSFLTV